MQLHSSENHSLFYQIFHFHCLDLTFQSICLIFLNIFPSILLIYPHVTLPPLFHLLFKRFIIWVCNVFKSLKSKPSYRYKPLKLTCLYTISSHTASVLCDTGILFISVSIK